MKKYFSPLLSLLLIPLYLSSAAVAQDSVGAVTLDKDPIAPIPPIVIAEGLHGSKNKRKTILINNQEDFEELWVNQSSFLRKIKAPPKLDFDHFSVLALFLGNRSTNGHDISLKKLKSRPKRSTAVVVETSPKKGCEPQPILTSPYQILVIEKTKRVKVKTRTVKQDCL